MGASAATAPERAGDAADISPLSGRPPDFAQLSGLAARTVKTRTARLDGAEDRAATALCPARLAFATVDLECMLEVSKLAVRLTVVAQCRPPAAMAASITLRIAAASRFAFMPARPIFPASVPAGRIGERPAS